MLQSLDALQELLVQEAPQTQVQAGFLARILRSLNALLKRYYDTRPVMLTG